MNNKLKVTLINIFNTIKDIDYNENGFKPFSKIKIVQNFGINRMTLFRHLKKLEDLELIIQKTLTPNSYIKLTEKGFLLTQKEVGGCYNQCNNCEDVEKTNNCNVTFNKNKRNTFTDVTYSNVTHVTINSNTVENLNNFNVTGVTLNSNTSKKMLRYLSDECNTFDKMLHYSFFNRNTFIKMLRYLELKCNSLDSDRNTFLEMLHCNTSNSNTFNKMLRYKTVQEISKRNTLLKMLHYNQDDLSFKCNTFIKMLRYNEQNLIKRNTFLEMLHSKSCNFNNPSLAYACVRAHACVRAFYYFIYLYLYIHNIYINKNNFSFFGSFFLLKNSSKNSVGYNLTTSKNCKYSQPLNFKFELTENLELIANQKNSKNLNHNQNALTLDELNELDLDLNNFDDDNFDLFLEYSKSFDIKKNTQSIHESEIKNYGRSFEQAKPKKINNINSKLDMLLDGILGKAGSDECYNLKNKVNNFEIESYKPKIEVENLSKNNYSNDDYLDISKADDLDCDLGEYTVCFNDEKIEGNTNPSTKKNNAKKVALIDYFDFKEMSYLNRELILDFIEHRKSIKAGLTKTAVKFLIKKIKDLHGEGQDVNDCIENAIASGWKSIYPINNYNKNKNAEKSSNEPTELVTSDELWRKNFKCLVDMGYETEADYDRATIPQFRDCEKEFGRYDPACGLSSSEWFYNCTIAQEGQNNKPSVKESEVQEEV